MAEYDFDLFVIGAGSGGVRASRMAAQFGARVAVAEDRYLGGTCVNVGCVPKKLLAYAAQFDELFRDSRGFGWDTGAPVFDWETLIRNKDREIARLNEIYRNLLINADVTLFEARASLVDAHTVQVGDQQVTAEYILLAPGGWPWVPEFPGSDLVITSNELFHLEEFPHRALIVGGGYIAVEFASILNGLGVETQLVYRRDLFLRGFDAELRQQLAEEMQRKGVKLRFATEVERIERRGEALAVQLNDGSETEVDLVLYATGRRPSTDRLGLEQVGIRTGEQGHIEVNAQFQTSVPNIYAVGDVIGGMELTPVALAQGMAVARRLFKPELDASVNLENVPTAIFSQPNMATVGLSEEAARERYGEIRVYTAKFTQLKHTLSGNPEKTLMKLVVDAASDRVVGAHMLGPDAGEIIQGLAIAIKAGATKAQFDATIGIHPTAAEEFVTMRVPAR
ncbi:MAG: glutathione-disulfide reductase [Spongiibacteraceae bacterium]|nr:glutathione-disulfide reductase [Spongiibacteraceae bacterium]